jgi:hypothetical protein
MASLQPSSGFNVDRAKANIGHREVSRASRPAKEFGRPSERAVKGCRARTGRPIANNSEAICQRAKVLSSKKFKKASLIFKFSVSRLRQSPRNVYELSASRSQ